MTHRAPPVSIGMPVYNGEPFLKEALDSLLGQTFEDFELIISDNASTDRTQEICRDYEANDHRIHYSRNQANIGAVKNHNRVFHLSTGQYFKWASHDDVYAPVYLAKCVEILAHDPSVVLCHSKIRIISEEGRFLQDYPFDLRTDSATLKDRFSDLVLVDHWCLEVFGLTRREILARTGLMRSFSGSDKVLVAELGLYGPFFTIPQFLFCYRRRSPQRTFPTLRSREAWNNPLRSGRRVFPYWRNLSAPCLAIVRSPLTCRERLDCFRVMARWILRQRHGLVDDLATNFPPFVPLYTGFKYAVKGLASLATRFGRATR